MRGDLEWGSIPGLVRSSARRFGSSEALKDGPVVMDFIGLARGAAEVGRALMAVGIEAGDRVAIWAPNVWEWVVAALGTLDIGAVLVPLNTRFKGDEAGWILARSRARVLFTVDGFLRNDYVAMLSDWGGGPGTDRPVVDLPHLESIVVMRSEQAQPAGAVRGADGVRAVPAVSLRSDGPIWDWISFLAQAEKVGPEAHELRAASVGPEDPSDIIFTSGTTGRPKGAVITHGQSLRVYKVWSDTVGLARHDRYLIVNPFFHTFGYKAGFLACVMQGAVILPQSTFDVDQILDLVQREAVSVLPGPPTLHQAILDHPHRDRFDLSSLRIAVTGAAAIPVEMIRRMGQELTYTSIVTAYGLTESSGTVTMCRPEDDPVTIATTSGRAIPDIEVVVADDSGSEVERGHPGEILVRGYNVISEYFEDPEASAEAIDGEGWLHTGDIGMMDDRGYVTVTDRLKDMYIVGGFNAYPAEIENALLSCPGVAQAAVVGMADQRLGEVGAAFVIARPGADLDPEAIVAWCRDHMANFKVPRRVEVLDYLPLNAGGKVLKYELRQRLVVGR